MESTARASALLWCYIHKSDFYFSGFFFQPTRLYISEHRNEVPDSLSYLSFLSQTQAILPSAYDED
jgi:hypothetical protein